MTSFQIALALAAMGLLLCWWLLRRQTSGPSRRERASAPSERVDTIIGWPPSATRILSAPERNAYSTLVRALPEHMVLAQVPLSRFLGVPKRNSYADWLRRVGYQCVDFAVCDKNAQVIAVIELQADATPPTERAKKRLARMTRALQAAQIPLIHWRSDALPSVGAVRAAIAPVASAPAVGAAGAPVVTPQATSGLGAAAAGHAATAASRPAAAASIATALATAATSGNPFEDSRSDESADERIELLEPPPSTWFDDFDSEPMPLDPKPVRRPQTA